MWNGVIYILNVEDTDNKNSYALNIVCETDVYDISEEEYADVVSRIKLGAMCLNNNSVIHIKCGEILSIFANLSTFPEFYAQCKKNVARPVDFQRKFSAAIKSHASPTKENEIPFWDDFDPDFWIKEQEENARKVLISSIVSGMEITDLTWKNLQNPKYYTISNTLIVYSDIEKKGAYYFINLSDLIMFDFMEMQRRGIELKRCKNCGKYFVPETRSDEIYCNNIFKGNRTCRQIGYENKVNGNEVLREYRKIYKTQNARKQRNKDNIQELEQRFSDWSAYAKEQLVKCQNGEITLAEMRANISPTDWMKGGE